MNSFINARNDNTFIDKSIFIKNVIDASGISINILRPSGFGKTMNLSMLNSFFCNRSNHRNYFTDLLIGECDDYMNNHQGKYPIIYLDFKDCVATTLDEWINKYISLVVPIYQQFELNFTKYEEKEFQELKDGNPSGISYSISNLTKLLFEKFKQRVILLIDSYDNMFTKAVNHRYYDELMPYIDDIFRISVKCNQEYLKRCIMVGIHEFPFNPWKLTYGLFDYIFREDFGFTKDEVSDLYIQEYRKYYCHNTPIYVPVKYCSDVNFIFNGTLENISVNTTCRFKDHLDISQTIAYGELCQSNHKHNVLIPHKFRSIICDISKPESFLMGNPDTSED
jgi:hypothetical protein